MPLIRSGGRKILPVVIVLDGAAFKDRKQWKYLKQIIKKSAECLLRLKCETNLYILEYSSKAVWTIERLTCVSDINLVWDHSLYDGQSNLGKAFDALDRKMQSGAMFYEQATYEAPIVALLTGGSSDDDWVASYERLQQNPYFKNAHVFGSYFNTPTQGIIERVSKEEPVPLTELGDYFSFESVFCLGASEGEKSWTIDFPLSDSVTVSGGWCVEKHRVFHCENEAEKKKVAFKLRGYGDYIFAINKAKEKAFAVQTIPQGEERELNVETEAASQIWISGCAASVEMKFIDKDKVCISNPQSENITVKYQISHNGVCLRNGDYIVNEAGQMLLKVNSATVTEDENSAWTVAGAE